MLYWLVFWNIFYFSIYWEFHHPNWRNHIFQRGRLNHQPDKYWKLWFWGSNWGHILDGEIVCGPKDTEPGGRWLVHEWLVGGLVKSWWYMVNMIHITYIYILLGGLEHNWMMFPFTSGRSSSSQLTFTHSIISQRGRAYQPPPFSSHGGFESSRNLGDVQLP